MNEATKKKIAEMAREYGRTPAEVEELMRQIKRDPERDEFVRHTKIMVIIDRHRPARFAELLAAVRARVPDATAGEVQEALEFFDDVDDAREKYRAGIL